MAAERDPDPSGHRLEAQVIAQRGEMGAEVRGHASMVGPEPSFGNPERASTAAALLSC
jgi:hypothetical protein